MSNQLKHEAERLERLWAGEFGDAYTGRNAKAAVGRNAFWTRLLAKYKVFSVLEVGCNLGANLEWISKIVSPRSVFGVDVNDYALDSLRKRLPDVNAVSSAARELPFPNRRFDLVFTAGVLIHQPESTLPLVMAEIVRCSRHYVLAIEYSAEQTMEVPYRGQTQALFKRDYGRLYLESFPELRLLEDGQLTSEEGWDNVTYCLFEQVNPTPDIV